MATKLIPGQWYDDRDGDRLLAITENDVVCRDLEGMVFMHTFRNDDIAKFTHLPDCDGWDWQPPKPPLRVALGKTYRCRDGSTVKIIDKSNHDGFLWPWVGSNACTYTDRGEQSYDRGVQSPFDLIEEIPEPEPDYIDIHKASRLKVGDTVRVAKKTEPKGWEEGWFESMDAKNGKLGAIIEDKGRQGFRVKVESSQWNYPATSLVKVEPKWRPFANLDEAEPFFDQRLRAKGVGAVLRIVGIWASVVNIGGRAYSYDEAFDEFELLDGTPFGIKVLE